MKVEEPSSKRREETSRGSVKLLPAFLLIVASTIATIGLVEISLRIFPSLQPPNGPEVLSCVGGHEPWAYSKFGRTESPGNRYFERTNPAANWTLHINNEQGFRDTFDTGAPRVLVFGDSFTRGSLVSNGETFSDLLDVWTPEIGIRSFGIGGWGTGDELRAYRAIGGLMPHDLVVLAYYVGNDMADNVKAGYSLKDGSVFEPPLPKKPTSRPLHLRLQRWLLVNTHVTRLVLQTVNRVTGRRKHYYEYSKGEQRKLHLLMEALVRLFVDEAAKNGAKLLILTIPDFNEFVSRRAAAGAAEQRQMLRGIAKGASHVSVLSLRNAFKREDLDRIYGMQDKHLARYGQYLVARKLAPLIGATPGEFAARPPIKITADCSKVEAYAKALGAYGPGK